jgi:hypothetical protein
MLRVWEVNQVIGFIACGQASRDLADTAKPGINTCCGCGRSPRLLAL